MGITHLPANELKRGRAREDSRLALALNTNRNLVVFVHGFGGEAVRTWGDIPGAIRNHPAFADADLLFYGYRSMQSRANLSAAKFCKFMLDFWNGPSRYMDGRIADALGRTPQFQYRKLVIVAHSLGALVVRRAVLDGLSANANWALQSRLVLFAPAHLGAQQALNLAQAFADFMKIEFLHQFVEWKFQALTDLQPNSDFIRKLQRDVTRIHPAMPPAAARLIVFGENENVVIPDGYNEDPAIIVIHGRDHVTVCRADANYRDPLDHIEGQL